MKHKDEGAQASGIAAVFGVERRISITFSLVVLVLMLIVALVGAGFYRHLSERNEDELTAVIAGLLSDSINRVSFSGKYHARLLVEQIATSQPRIAYVIVSGLDNTIIAHSDPALNDKALDEESAEIAREILGGEETHARHYVRKDGSVKETALPYRSGYLDEISGVIFVGIHAQQTERALARTRMRISILIVVLTLLSLGVTYFLSRRIAAPVKSLASEFNGILEHAPLLVSIADRDGRIHESSAAYAAMMRDGADTLGPELRAVFAEGRSSGCEVRRAEDAGGQSFIITSFPIEYGGHGDVQLSCCIALDVTELEQARRELRNSEERLALALEGADLGTWDWNIASGGLTVNARWAAMLGYTREELRPRYRSWDELLHPDDREGVLGRLKEHLDHGGVYNPELRMCSKSGKWVWIQAWGKVTERDSDGKPLRMLGVHQDISARHEAEEAMRASETLFRTVFEHAQQLIGLLSIDGEVLRVNKKALEVAGCDLEAVIGVPFWRTIWWKHSPELQERVREAVERARRGEHVRFDATLVRPNGETAYLDFSLTPVQDVDGQIIYLLPESHDITERILNEEEVRRLRALLRNVIDSMPSVLVGVDLDGRITQWNRGAREMTGRTELGACGQLLAAVFPELAREVDRAWEAVLRKETYTRERITLPTIRETRSFDVTVYPLVSEEVEGAVVRVDDVTERARMEEMMIQSEKMLSLGGLAAGMAHEINNPLAGILQNAQVMRGRLTCGLHKNEAAAKACGTTVDAVSEYAEVRGILQMLDSLRDSGKRAAGIVENMLSFSRKAEGSAGPQDIGELLDRTVELAENDYDLKKEFDFRRIRIVREYDPDTPAVPCEASKVQQVFLNILNNGARAMAGGGTGSEEPCFTLRIQADPGWVRIEIEDNGPGMDEAVRRRIFEPFYTTRKVGRGTGLGLSVSYFIITKSHGGTMEVESEPGKGSTFIIRLPRERGGTQE